jgi:hypothetical protein
VGLAAAVLLAVGPAGPASAPTPGRSLPAGTGLPAETVTILGPGTGVGSLGETLPSGQPLAYRAIAGWGLPPGVQAGVATVARDGTVLLAGRDHHGGTGPATAGVLVIGAYQPDLDAYRTIPLATTGGRYEVDPAGDLMAPSVSGLTPIHGGEAVAFITSATTEPEAGNADTWPAFGVLSKVDGRWGVTAGDGWTNQWTGTELVASGQLGRLRELVSLPGSGDLIVAREGAAGERNGALLAMRLAGPDPEGRYAVTVTGQYRYPEIRDPESGEYLELTLRDLRADPTGEPGDERFVVGLQDPSRSMSSQPVVVQEFSYAAATGAITPISAPTIPGDDGPDGAGFFGYSAVLYDHAGNLWAARHRGLTGGKLAIYARSDQHRGLDRPDCRYDPGAPAGSHVTTSEGRSVWGRACRPDFDIVQPQAVPAIIGMVQDPGSHDVVALTLGGAVLAVRPSGSGDAMTFEVGNVVDTGLQLLPAATGSVREHQLGGLDRSGRLWLPGAQAVPDEPGAAADQWLYAVRIGDLFDPAPVRLPDVPGQVATIQAEHTLTTATEAVPGSWATVDFNSRAYVRPCADWHSAIGCSYDDVPGNGYTLAHRSGFGHLGGEVAYRVEVPVAGSYRIAFRVATFAVTTDAAIRMSVAPEGPVAPEGIGAEGPVAEGPAGQTYTTPISTADRWRTVPQQELVELPVGVHTIRLWPPYGQGGWWLSWLTLQRA